MIEVNGILFDEKEIERIEETLGGEVVRDEKVNRILDAFICSSSVMNKGLCRFRISDYPEYFFYPVIVDVDISGIKYPTNKVIFVKTRRLF